MLFLAIRHLLARKKQTFLILFGISLGSLVYVMIASMQLGFREFIIDQLINNDAHVRISAPEEEVTEEGMTKAFYGEKYAHVFWLVPPSGGKDEPHIVYPQGWFERLGREPDVEAFSPQIKVQIIANHGGNRRSGQVIGIDPQKQSRVTNISKYMVSGKLETIGSGGRRVVIGDGLMKRLGARMSSTILISSGSGVPRPYKIVGIFHLGVQTLDDTTIYGAINDVQQLNQTPGRITDIAVRLYDVTAARALADSWSSMSTDKVLSWDQANANFLQIFKLQDIIRISITLAVLLVAGFGIYNVLTILISQKKREIAILRSIGFGPVEILFLFLTQGLILGFSGAIIGLLLGYGLCHYMETIDLEFMGRKGFFISYDLSIYTGGFSMAVIASAVASLLPAYGASKLTPIEIIRSEG